MHYFDVIHDSFLPRYLEVLARDARKAAERLDEHSVEIAAGVGYSDFSVGHQNLRPLEPNHSYDLTQPCTIHIGRLSTSLAISVDKSSGEISSALLPGAPVLVSLSALPEEAAVRAWIGSGTRLVRQAASRARPDRRASAGRGRDRAGRRTPRPKHGGPPRLSPARRNACGVACSPAMICRLAPVLEAGHLARQHLRPTQPTTPAPPTCRDPESSPPREERGAAPWRSHPG